MLKRYWFLVAELSFLGNVADRQTTIPPVARIWLRHCCQLRGIQFPVRRCCFNIYKEGQESFSLSVSLFHRACVCVCVWKGEKVETGEIQGRRTRRDLEVFFKFNNALAAASGKPDVGWEGKKEKKDSREREREKKVRINYERYTRGRGVGVGEHA